MNYFNFVHLERVTEQICSSYSISANIVNFLVSEASHSRNKVTISHISFGDKKHIM